MSFRFFLDVVAVGGGMAGSLIVASNPGAEYIKFGYLFFLLSSFATIKILMDLRTAKQKVGSLLFTNGYFLLVNIIGIIRYSI